MIVLLIFAGLVAVKAVRKLMNTQQVAIFSADRKATQGKQTNVTQQPFKSTKQAGQVNTHRVGPTVSPSNPQGMN